MMKKLASGLALLTLRATSAHAGASYEAAYCEKNTDGSGNCYGTMLAFRNHWSSSTYASFEDATDSLPAFRASYQFATSMPVINVYCVPTSTVRPFFSRAASHTGYFAISWNAAGECTRLTLSSGSRYATP
jgi:hypothetical protein